jgi:hypothetical protein
LTKEEREKTFHRPHSSHKNTNFSVTGLFLREKFNGDDLSLNQVKKKKSRLEFKRCVLI